MFLLPRVPLPTSHIPASLRHHSERRSGFQHAHGNIGLGETFFNGKMAETTWTRRAIGQQIAVTPMLRQVRKD
jgi:hypothetical protein